GGLRRHQGHASGARHQVSRDRTSAVDPRPRRIHGGAAEEGLTQRKPCELRRPGLAYSPGHSTSSARSRGRRVGGPRRCGRAATLAHLDREERSMAKHWLFKTEPSTYSFAQLRAEGRATWDGVKNPLALKHLANVAEGDFVFIYHTGDEKAVVGVARAASGPYPDPKAKDAKLLVVDLTPVRLLDRPVSLAAIKASKRFGGFD